jgi:hypothetical protein
MQFMNTIKQHNLELNEGQVEEIQNVKNINPVDHPSGTTVVIKSLRGKISTVNVRSWKNVNEVKVFYLVAGTYMTLKAANFEALEIVKPEAPVEAVQASVEQPPADPTQSVFIDTLVEDPVIVAASHPDTSHPETLIHGLDKVRDQAPVDDRELPAGFGNKKPSFGYTTPRADEPSPVESFSSIPKTIEEAFIVSQLASEKLSTQHVSSEVVVCSDIVPAINLAQTGTADKYADQSKTNTAEIKVGGIVGDRIPSSSFDYRAHDDWYGQEMQPDAKSELGFFRRLWQLCKSVFGF